MRRGVISLSQGRRLGFGIMKRNSQCVVATKDDLKAPVEIGDTIISLNGITLSQVHGGLDAWVTLFSAFAHDARTIVVHRAPKKKQPSFDSRETKKKVKKGRETKKAKKDEITSGNDEYIDLLNTLIDQSEIVASLRSENKAKNKQIFELESAVRGSVEQLPIVLTGDGESEQSAKRPRNERPATKSNLSIIHEQNQKMIK
eukprot:scaffold108009_cov65-Cyclotella_meneghiniana.AAC.1